MSTIEAKLGELGLELPIAPPPVGAYVPVIRTGNLVVTSGQLPFIGKQLAFDVVDRNAEQMTALSDSIFFFGEPGMQEFEATRLLKGTLEAAGFRLL